MIDIQTMTPQEIHQAGIEVLRRELGVVGMIRFLQQYERGVGDYSVERHTWLDVYTTEEYCEAGLRAKGCDKTVSQPNLTQFVRHRSQPDTP